MQVRNGVGKSLVVAASLSPLSSFLSYDNREKAWLPLYWTVGAKSKSLPEDDASSYEYVLSSPTPQNTILLLLLLQHSMFLSKHPYLSIRISPMRQVPLERDINIAVNGCSWFVTSTQKGPFKAMFTSPSRGTYLIDGLVL